jgi:hypothetical protein
MTVRARLRGWFRFLLGSVLAVGACASAWPDTEFNHAFRLIVIGALAASLLTLFAMGFRCPRCRATLIPSAVKILGVGPFACPRCGASTDTPS